MKITKKVVPWCFLIPGMRSLLLSTILKTMGQERQVDFFPEKGEVGEAEFLRKSLGLRIFENTSCNPNVCVLETSLTEVSVQLKNSVQVTVSHKQTKGGR